MRTVETSFKIRKGEIFGVLIDCESKYEKLLYVESHHRTEKAANRRCSARLSRLRSEGAKFEVVKLKQGKLYSRG